MVFYITKADALKDLKCLLNYNCMYYCDTNMPMFEFDYTSFVNHTILDYGLDLDLVESVEDIYYEHTYGSVYELICNYLEDFILNS